MINHMQVCDNCYCIFSGLVVGHKQDVFNNDSMILRIVFISKSLID